MTTVPYYISETVYSPSLRAGAAPARRGRPIAVGRRSIDLRPKYLNPMLPIHKLFAFIQLTDAKLALAMSRKIIS